MTSKYDGTGPAIEDLASASQAAWRLGRDLCTDCGGYHRVWGLLRAAGAVGGPTVDAPLLEPLIRSLTAPGSRILLAGSADAGLLAMVLSATPRPLRVTVADMCPTPLAVIEGLALSEDVAVTTLLTDVGALEGEQVWDLVICHSMLPFVPENERQNLASALKKSLAPNGRAIIVARTSRRMNDQDVAAHDTAWLDQTRVRIADSGLALPGPAAEVEALLAVFAARRREQLAGFETAEDIADVLRSGGLRIVQSLSSHESTRIELNARTHVRRSQIFVCDRD